MVIYMMSKAKIKKDIERLENEYDLMQERADAVEDNDIWAKLDQEACSFRNAMIAPRRKLVVYLSVANQPNDDWFRNFCMGLRHNQYMTYKQQYWFEKYARYASYDGRNYSYRTIVDGNIYTLGDNRIYISPLPDCWKEYDK